MTPNIIILYTDFFASDARELPLILKVKALRRRNEDFRRKEAEVVEEQRQPINWQIEIPELEAEIRPATSGRVGAPNRRNRITTTAITTGEYEFRN